MKPKKRLVRIAFYQEVPEDATEEEIVAWAKYELHQICELRLDNAEVSGAGTASAGLPG